MYARAMVVDALGWLIFGLHFVEKEREGTNRAMMMNANKVWYSRHTIIPVLLFQVAALHCERMVALARRTRRPRERAQRPRRTPLRIRVCAGGRAAPA